MFMLTATDEAAFAPAQRFRKPTAASISIFIPGTTSSLTPNRLLAGRASPKNPARRPRVAEEPLAHRVDQRAVAHIGEQAG
jgi:hypothetical protein